MSSTNAEPGASFGVQRAMYNGLVLPVAYGLLSAASHFNPKLKETLQGQKNIRSRWASVDAIGEQPIWFHVSSVGEYEQAKPVIDRLRTENPAIPVALTFTSPSGYRFATRKENLNNVNNIKFLDYLPIDFQDNARFCLDILKPRMLVFVKFDLWPNLIWEAKKRGIPSLLIDATLSEGSYRFSGVGRRFYRAVYANLDRILAISSADADRFRRCAPRHRHISVAGDTRFDRVVHRKRQTGESITIDSTGRFVIVLGSTWPKDEAHVLGALSKLAGDERNLLLLMVPHEPSVEHIANLESWAISNGFETQALSNGGVLSKDKSHNQALIVDTVGMLAEIYRHADVAYVGGSFSTGVHSVIEPAIMGIPTLFGPNHENSFEALELLKHDAARTINNETELYHELRALAKDAKLRQALGDRARAYVESQLGATDHCMEAIDACMG